MRLATVLALLLIVGICTTPAMAAKDDPVKNEGDPRLPVDYDYYQISLTSGVQVVIELMAGPHCDPDVGDTKMYLYGPGSCTTQVGYNDDISYPTNNYSRITYTPTVSGVYYIKAQGYSSSYEGCYKMTVMCAGVAPTTLVDEVEPNDTCGATVPTLTCDNYVHGRIGVPVASGACCTPCGACTITTQAACLTPNIWHGEWLTCEPNPCPIVNPIPTNDTCAGAIEIPCGTGVLNGTVACANPDYNPPDVVTCTDYTAVGPDVTYVMNLQAGQIVNLILDPTPNYDCAIYIVTDCADLTTCLVGSDVNVSSPDQETIAAWPAPATGTYYVICDKYSIAAGDGFTLTYDISCPAVLGACCDTATGACTITTQAECLFTWLGEGVPCDAQTCPVPVQEAACCFADGHCELLTYDACMAAADHVSWIPGAICPPTANPCPQPGACCDLLTGACTFVLEQFCVTPLVFHAELTCLPVNPCEQPGACCDPATGNCVFVLQAACPQGWTWYVGVACLPTNPCPPPVATGACCDPLGNCTVTIQDACLAPNVWHPEWISCVPNYCPPPVPTEGTTWGQIKANYR